MTKAAKQRRTCHILPGMGWKLTCCFPCLVFLLTGCASASSWKFWPWGGGSESAAPQDSMVLGGGSGGGYLAPEDKQAFNELEGAKRLYQEKEYSQAERAFSKIKSQKKLPVPILEESLFFEADCQYLQKNLRSAEGTYKAYLKAHPNGRFAAQVNRRLFDIGDFWLETTRLEMRQREEKREGKRMFVMPASFIHFDKEKPMFDVEGHALQLLDDVRLHDIKGELGEKSLFYIGTVKFYREEYRDADFYFTQLYEHYPNSKFAAKAIKQSIVCKMITSGGSAYDTRTVEECRKIIHKFAGAYPELAKDEKWLRDQLVSINLQQADRDFNIAEFYRRTGHPGSAYFYYELVRRRYPNTDYAKKSGDRMQEIKGRVETEQQTLEEGGNSFLDSLRNLGQVTPTRASQAPSMFPQNFAPNGSP